MEKIYNPDQYIEELLQVLLDNIEYCDRGLCELSNYLHETEVIEIEEMTLLLEYIRDNRPSMFSSWSTFSCFFSDFYWKMNDNKNRIKWLKYHIKINTI